MLLATLLAITVLKHVHIPWRPLTVNGLIDVTDNTSKGPSSYPLVVLETTGVLAEAHSCRMCFPDEVTKGFIDALSS